MDYFETCSKKGRGMAQRSLELIEAMCAVTRDAHPITGRGVGYKLFTRGLIGINGQIGNAARLSLAAGGARARANSVGVDR